MWQIFFLCFSFVFFGGATRRKDVLPSVPPCSSFSRLLFPIFTSPLPPDPSCARFNAPISPPTHAHAASADGGVSLSVLFFFLYETPCRLSRTPPTPGTYLNQPFAPSHTRLSSPFSHSLFPSPFRFPTVKQHTAAAAGLIITSRPQAGKYIHQIKRQVIISFRDPEPGRPRPAAKAAGLPPLPLPSHPPSPAPPSSFSF